MSGVYTASGMAEAMGVSYRQLDYWVREGWIKPTAVNDGDGRRTPGTGHARVWVGRDAKVAVMFARLVSIGMSPAEIGVAAERLVDNGRATLAWGLSIVAEGTGTRR